MPHAREHLLANERKIEERHQREPRIEINPRQYADHRGHDDHDHQRREVALSFLVAFRKERNRQRHRREQHRDGKHHCQHAHETEGINQRNHTSRWRAGPRRARFRHRSPATTHQQRARHKRGHPHREQHKAHRRQRTGKHHQEFPQDDIDPRHRTAQQRFHRPPLLLPRRQIHRRIHRPRET